MTVEEVLARLHRVKRAGPGWQAACPAHEDHSPSLSIGVGEDGRVLLHCHAGCKVDAILSELGLGAADLFDGDRGRRIAATYDYVDEENALLFQVVRFEPKQFMQRRPDGRGGWIWKLGSTRRVLYRLPRVLEAVAAGEIVYVVEGEQDVHAVEQAGATGTCNPGGAGKWRSQYSKLLRGADVVIVQDLDDAGRRHAADVAASLAGIARSVLRVEAAAGKDAADHLASGRSLDELVTYPDDTDSRTDGPAPASVSGEDVRPGESDGPGQAPRLALEKDILVKLREDLPRAGLAGEEQLAQLIYLALTSRCLPWGKPTERPVSAIAKGSTSTGKSHATKTTLRFFPASAYFDLGSFSRRYLFYTEEELAHRFVYVPEWASLKDDDELVAMLRTLLSEGRIVHGTVEGDGRRTARRIEKAGPTGLLMTTTAAAVDAEMETRCLSIVTDDSVEQTKNVYKTLAALENEVASPVDFDAWHQLQAWLDAHGESRVVVPFVATLAELMPAGATRLRRDFVTLICLVRAHAILHRATREQDEHGRIVATVDGDYAPVRDLVAALIAEAVEAGVSKAMRDTVEAVAALIKEGAAHVSPTALTTRLGVGRSATYDRIRRALLRGYLVNEASKDERRMKLVLGTSLPGGEEFLPSPQVLVQVSPDEPPGHGFGSTIAGSGAMSGSPGRPPDPPYASNETAAAEAPKLREWLARDGKWRSLEDEPPGFAGEVIETRYGKP